MLYSVRSPAAAQTPGCEPSQPDREEGRIENLREDQIVFSQGDAADAVFYIEKGKVKVTVVSPQGKEAVVAILEAKDFFGEGCLAGQQHRMATVTAMTDCVIARLDKAA